MKKTYLYLSGQSQWLPKWMEYLPPFCYPLFRPPSSFIWFGLEVKCKSLAGETLFMCWRRKLTGQTT